MAKFTKSNLKREYAIKTETLSNGKVVCVPMTRTVSKYIFIPVRSPWVRITETHGFYEVRDIDFEPQIEIDCVSIIKGYQQQLKRATPDYTISTQLQIINDQNETSN